MSGVSDKIYLRSYDMIKLSELSLLMVAKVTAGEAEADAAEVSWMRKKEKCKQCKHIYMNTSPQAGPRVVSRIVPC